MRSAQREARPVRATGRARLGALAILIVLAAAGVGAAGEPPRVARIRVPAAKVADWFPAGTPLRMIAPAELDALLRGASRGAAPAGPPTPRLVRARHHARWDGKALAGRSELLVEPPAAGSAILALDPWTPTIRPSDRDHPPVGSLATGQTVLVLSTEAAGSPAAGEAALTRIVLEWEQRALPDTEDRGFSLGLPGDESSTLTLELPEDATPTGPEGPREGPLAATAAGGRPWVYHGRPGAINLRILDAGRPRSARDGDIVWVAGDTRIDLGPEPRLDPRAANWVAEWAVQPAPRGSLEFTAELDPGVELVDVSGPDLREYQVTPSGKSTRVRVRIGRPAGPETRVRFMAHAKVPMEGAWSVPAIRPVDATWTGGSTTIRLDALRVLEDCRERSGRRVPSAADAGESDVLVFEASSPGSVADLVFRAPGSASPCRVFGRMRVDGSGAGLECQISGLGGRGTAAELEAELSPGWIPSRVAWSGTDQALSWNHAPMPNGRTRLRVRLPAGEVATAASVLGIEATSSTQAVREPLALPRVRPIGVTIADELWVAVTDRISRLTPTSARGLAWIDSAKATPPDGFPPAPAESRPEFAWRWVGEDADAHAEREILEPEAHAEISTRARIDGGGGRLLIDGEIAVRGPTGLVELPIWFDMAEKDASAWAFFDVADGSTVASRPLTSDDRSRYGFPGKGSARVLSLPGPRDGKARIRYRAELRREPRGTIPLVMTPGQFQPRATILIEAPRDLPTSAQAVGASRIDPAVAERLAEAWRPSASPVAGTTDVFAIAHAYSYRDPGASITLATTSLPETAVRGLIRDAALTTVLSPEGPRPNHLRLLANVEAGHTLDLRLPSGISLVRVRVDGEDAPVLSRDGGLAIVLPGAVAGLRPRTIEVDYEAEGGRLADGSTITPTLPAVDIPCLSFTWELIAPPGWRTVNAGGELVAAEPDAPLRWPFDQLGVPSLSWRGKDRSSSIVPEATWNRLDEGLSGLIGEETSLAGWFTRWDSSPTPLIIDRVALAAAGYGPRSLCSVRGDRSAGAIARRTLQEYGLALVPIDGTLIVTTTSALAEFENTRTWKPAVDEALLWGSDGSDRLQGVSRWRGESTPGGAVGRPDSAGLRRLPGWSAWHFDGVSWPGPSARVQIRDGSAAAGPGWIIATIMAIALGSLGLRISPRRALLLPIALMTLFVTCRLWMSDSVSGPLAGGFVGSAAGLLLAIGRTISMRDLRRRPAPEPAGIGIRLTRSMARIAPSITATIILLHVAPAVGRDDAPIPILFPYEGSFEPGQVPAQVVLRQADYEELRRLSRPQPRPEAPGPILVEAQHRLSWRGERDVVVASSLELVKLDPSGDRWIIPVDGSKELEASLDGRTVPVFIEPGGATAAVSISGAGRHDLKLRRIVTIDPSGATRGVNVPINAHPSARLVVEKPPEARPVYFPGLQGERKVGEDGSFTASLGPTSRIEIRTGEPGGIAPREAGTNMEGLLLYDIQPAGDRLRARFTYRGSSPLPQVSFLMDSKLLPRSMKVPGLVQGTWSGTDEEPVWTARVDPPLQEGAVIEFDLWRPREEARKGEADGPAEKAAPVETVVKHPRLEPLRVDRYAGALGVRRPGHWTGRLEPIRGAEPLSDEGFVKLWGPLPDDRLTFCGTTRLGRDDRPELRTGPSVARVRVRPNLELTIEEGRILVNYEAELGDTGVAIDHLELNIPNNLAVLSVESEGLTTWSRRGPRSLMLRFDRPVPTSRRKLSLSGWIPVPEDTTRRGGRAHRMAPPWIEVPGMETLAGSLAIASRMSADLVDPRGGAIAGGAASTGKSSSEKPERRVFRVDDPARLGTLTLTWVPLPPQVDVRVDSQMTIGPDHAEWVAVVRYGVRGGALDSVRLRMPRSWAEAATARFDGQSHRRAADDRGSASVWTLTPERPLWGSQRLVIRSSLALTPGQEILHPEIIPIGASSVTTNLALVYPDGTPLTTAGSSTFQQVAYAGRFRDEEFRPLPGTQARAFHVEREPWSLKVQVPPVPGEARGDAVASARAASADVDVVVLPDRSVRGRSVFDVQPGTSRFLEVEVPAGGSMLWATADHVPTRPLRQDDRHWLVPLGQRAASRVAIYWDAPASGTDPSSGWSLAVPSAGPDRASARVSIRVPDGLAVRTASGELEVTSADRLLLDRADRIKRQLGDFINQMDRGSGRDREQVASLLIAHELNLRAAERSIRWSSRHLAADRRERAERELAVIQSARKGVLEVVRAAALDDEVAAAQAYLGAAPAPSPAVVSVAEPAVGDRLRGLGRPTFLLGIAPGLAEDPPVVTISGGDQAAASEGETADRARALLTLGVLAAIGLASILRANPGAWGLFILGATLALLAFIGGPIPTVAGAVAVMAGRLSRGSSGRTSESATEPSSLRPLVTAAG